MQNEIPYEFLDEELEKQLENVKRVSLEALYETGEIDSGIFAEVIFEKSKNVDAIIFLRISQRELKAKSHQGGRRKSGERESHKEN